jgi:RNase P subunit RPR2
MDFCKRFIRFAVALINDRGFEYEAGGKLVSCNQCGTTQFQKSKAQLNTKEMTILRMDFFDKSAKTLQCKKCGHILWFGKSPVNRILSKENLRSTK